MTTKVGTVTAGRDLVVLFTLITLGCGARGPAEVPVHGRITFDGKSLEQGVVIFYPIGVDLRPIRSSIESNGTYELSAPPGDYKVTVDSFKQFTPDLAPDDPGYRAPESLVPNKYSNFLQTQLRFTINNQASTIDLDLISS